MSFRGKLHRSVSFRLVRSVGKLVTQVFFQDVPSLLQWLGSIVDVSTDKVI